MKIDLVYLWVDGSDEKWLMKKNVALKEAGELSDESAGEKRYFDNGELMFSLRSVKKYASWINHIFIVTDNQIPKWLNTNHPKITIVDHTEIMPKEILPCFSSTVIEFFLYNIPKLSEYFLFANDDMMFTAKTRPKFFFTRKGIPIIRAHYKNNSVTQNSTGLFQAEENFRILWEREDDYRRRLLNSMRLIYDVAGDFNCNWEPHHNIDPYRKSDMRNVMDIPLIKKVLEKTLKCRFRDKHNLQRTLFHMYGLAKYGYELVIQQRSETDALRFKEKSFYMEDIKKETQNNKLKSKLICVGDTGDPEIRKSNRECLLKMYPKKSKFEK